MGVKRRFISLTPPLFIQQIILPASNNEETKAPLCLSSVKVPSNTNELPLHGTRNVESVPVPWRHLERWQPFFISFVVTRWLIRANKLGGFWFKWGPVWWWGPSAINLINVVGDYYSTPRWRYISVNASHFTEIRLFVQQLVRSYNKENIKAPLYCSFVRGLPCDWGTGGFSLQRASNAQSVSMPWRGHEKWQIIKTLPLFYWLMPGLLD